VVSLLTDFGQEGPYPSAMKGVILQICPQAQIVDVSHLIPPFNVRYGAFILAQSAPFFPQGTVHLAVVDPGVGTERRPIVIQTRRFLFVGPDNGLLSIAAERDGVAYAWEIRNPRYMLDRPSMTFHGRDIFAPVAAHLANGLPPEKLGPRLDSFQRLAVSQPHLEGNEVSGEVLLVDHFGNLVTNIEASMLQERIRLGETLAVYMGPSVTQARLLRTYGEAEPGQALVLAGSSGLLEVAVNRGSAAELFKASAGTPIRLKLLL